MRRRNPGAAEELAAAESGEDAAALRQRIRADLERRGLDRAASVAVAAQLEALASSVDPQAYLAALEGAAAAHQVLRSEGGIDAPAHSGREVEEIQRLMHGFAGELRKLEEGLRIVSAYVLRMHTAATRERRSVLH